MGLFDGYFDPQQWPDSGGLLSRLVALQQQQGQDQPDPSSDQSRSVPQVPGPMSTWSPMLANFGQMPSATVDPEIGKTPTGPGQTGQQGLGDTDDTGLSGNSLAGPDHEASSTASGQPPGLNEAAYRETPANANQAFGELSDIRARNRQNTVSGEDYLSGVREGNVRRNRDESLDVTNGTVVTLSLKDGVAKTVTVTNTDIAHIDPNTGEVVIKKAPLGNGI